MSFKRATLAAVLAALPFAIHAADSALSEIVVKGTQDDGQSTAKVDSKSIQSMRPATSDTASLLRNIPGLSLYGAGGVSSLPVIHGLADDRVRTTVDGMDLISACGNHMNPPLSYIDPTRVGSIKVFAGIAPVSMGGDSIGGTIMVDSAPPEFAEPGQSTLRKGEAGAFYRSNGNAKGGNLSATVANEKMSVTYSGSTSQSDDYKAAEDFKPAGLAAAGRGWLDGDEVGSSMYKSTNQSLSMALRQGRHLVDLKLGVQDIPYQGYPNQRMDMTGNDSTQINLRYKGQFDWGALEARVYDEKTRHRMQFGDDKLYWYGTVTPPTINIPDGVPGTVGTNLAAGMPMDTQGKNNGVSLKADIVLSDRDLLRVGGELQHFRLDDWWDPAGKGMWPNTFWNIRDGQRDRLAAYAEWDAQWTPQWFTDLGIRHETVDMNAGPVSGYNEMPMYKNDVAAFNASDRQKTDRNLDLTAFARYVPDAMRTFEFGYAQKTRSPNLYERYAWSTGGMAMNMINMTGDGNGYVGNLDLQPEVAHTLSATADWHDAEQQNWGLKVTPYYTYVNDYINARRCAAADTKAPAGTAAIGCFLNSATTATSFVFLKYANQDARLYGLDVSGHFPLAKNTGIGSFTATGMLNYVRGKTVTGAEDDLYNIMPLNAKLAVVQKISGWSNTVEVQLVKAKTNVSAIRKEQETAGYGLLNLRGSYEWKQARFDVGIDNVLDKFYYYPLGGAYVGQGKTMPPMAMMGTPSWGTQVPGMGRSLHAGVTIKF